MDVFELLLGLSILYLAFILYLTLGEYYDN